MRDTLSGSTIENRIQRVITNHLRRILVLIISLFMGRVWLYAVIGFLNRSLFKKAIRNVFLLYAADERYLRKYVYRWYARCIRWTPCLLGVMRQNGRWGLYLGIGVTERMLSEDDGKNLSAVFGRMERIRILIGAEQKTFAGIIPGLLKARRILNVPIEQEITAAAVHRAIDQVKRIEEMPDDTPLLVIGGLGFIGRRVIEYVRNNGFPGPIYSVDLKGGEEFEELAFTLRGRPTICLNVSRRGALKRYIPSLWPEVVVLNEVYPEPDRWEVDAIRGKGARCYHISGVAAWAWPSFPKGYKGGIPCCASFLPGKGEGEYRVLMKKLCSEADAMKCAEQLTIVRKEYR